MSLSQNDHRPAAACVEDLYARYLEEPDRPGCRGERLRLRDEITAADPPCGDSTGPEKEAGG